MKKKFKKTLRSNTHPIKPKMVIKSKKDKLNTRRAKKIDMRKMLDFITVYDDGATFVPGSNVGSIYISSLFE